MLELNSHRHSRRLVLKMLAGAAAVTPVALLQACAPGGPASTSSATAPTAAPDAPTTAAVAGRSLQKVRYGDLRLLSDAGVYIALDEGYFAEQGIDLELTSFDSASNMVPPLGAGQIDAGGGALSAGLFNAMARGVKLLVVADKGHSDPTPPGSPISIFMVRKALVDSGEIKSPADLKGRKYGYVARGISTELDLASMLKQGDLGLKDLEMVQMGFPDMVAAFASGGIDAAGPGEPFATNILKQGTGVILRRDYEVNPNNQVAALLYSEKMGKSNLGHGFMVAYLKAVRLYNDAFVKRQPAAREKAIKAMVAHSPVKDPALYDTMALQALHPDGAMNVPSIEQQQEFFLSDHTQETRIDVKQFIDTRFIEQAASELGAYA